RLWPRPEQPASEVAQVHVPEREMKQNRQYAPLPCVAQHGLAQGRCDQLPALGAYQSCRLSELTNDMQRQEVWFVDHLVESERLGLIVVRPFNELAHLTNYSP